ncbi:MAG TPA: asparagine synthase (glutamine-hydrolyzing) [Candidatus Binatia bacterium]|nr:asparagine synthase (glutamine-hydrolyzing) [Candidatus Binatia bacterium]
MCGIAGVFAYGDTAPPDFSVIHRMTSTLVHRGPDDEGYRVRGPMALGHRRLSIIDPAGGHQPMANETEHLWLICNGEIYNFRELRDELTANGHRFRTYSDNEVVLHAYEEWGDDCVAHFNGMFAFALWDDLNWRLLLARDHFGVKPLYYADTGAELVFGSEIKAILASRRVTPAVDPAALELFWHYRFVPSPGTLLRGVQRVPPGFRVICDRRGVRCERYSAPVPQPLSETSEAHCVTELRTRLTRAVERQLVADVPVGMFLSGGVDSSVIAALMARNGATVQSFAVGFPGDEPLSELGAARDVASWLKTDHHEVTVSAREFADELPACVRHLEEPTTTTSIVPLFVLARLAGRSVKVVLTGQGADEPFGGYHRYLGERFGAWYRRLPSIVREGLVSPLVERLPGQERAKRAVRSLGNVDDATRFLALYALLPEPQMQRLLGQPRLTLDERLAPIEQWRAGVRDLDPLSQLMYVDARLSLADDLLLYGDKMAMAWSLEARVPFLDLELMEFAERIPGPLKLKGGECKYLHKRTVAAWLPESIVRRRKMGFGVPTARWFCGELREFVHDTLGAPHAAWRAYFAPDGVDAVLAGHRSGRENYERQIFALLTFELWHQQFIGGAASADDPS